MATLKTPENCTADFSLIPIGSQSASFSKQVADIQRLMQNSGLKFQMHATGTIVEGSIQTDIRITTRTDKVQPMEANIASVQRALAT
ncbi:thiamine-binding protein [Aspergillus tubingensis]|uniref:thiamine-binding protein n=1 Tax=Aspergillus tubingensis TaxID=5068 RepID=UPI001579DA7C|nr:cell wall biogenesis protein [Aspergillus tubingensis]GFN16952.1 cell wall biogenesis protein [Aspergillus tubingensis]